MKTYIGELNEKFYGKEVTLSGWVHEVRELGAVVFLLLRDSTGIVQITGKKGIVGDMVIKSMRLPKESVIEVKGIVKENKEAKKGFEVVPSEIKNLNPLSAKIPFEVTGKVDADLDVRLDYRYIDLRRLESSAIFKIQSTIANSFMNKAEELGFTHIRTPSIVAEATEGGAELFSIDYFERKGFLAQSPQIYKQLAAIGGLERVFTITPVFRAEKSNTIYHLNEITQMDIEMAFANHEDVIGILAEMLRHIVKEVISKNKNELDILGRKLEVPDVKIIDYKDAIGSINSNGSSITFGEDFSREHEKALEKAYGDAVIVKNYPTAIRSFYSMPNEKDPSISNSFDLIYKGLEVSSGAQRIHLPDLLIEAIKKRGMDPKNFEGYINAMRCGAPPHAGWSIGLERLTLTITGMDNIRECCMFPRDRKRITP
ncbi:MAG: aspartate--tRNA(Asn) ligase [Candidatus Micrarchaeaceae archaeon]